MITLKRLSECTFEEGLRVWNCGFEEYFVDMTFTMDRWIGRFGAEGLSPEHSVVAYCGDELAGFVLSGIRKSGDIIMAGNNGTGVVPKFRGQGVGKKLIEASLEIYREQGVELAILEAIANNDRAVRLYEKMGYGIRDKVTFLQLEGALNTGVIQGDLPNYEAVRGIPVEASHLSFYQHVVPWQTAWQNIPSGESVVLYENGQPVGYALYKRTFKESSELASIALYQCVARPDYDRQRDVLRSLLFHVHSPHDVLCKRYTVNIPRSNTELVQLLEELGFTTFVDQVFMAREMESVKDSSKLSHAGSTL